MNKDRRRRLTELIDKINDIKDEIIMVREEEQEAFDNLPEGLQAGEKGQAMEENYFVTG